MLITRPLPSDIGLLALHRLDPARYPVLLESVAHGTAQGRWDMLLVSTGTDLVLGTDGVTRDGAGELLQGRFLDLLDARWQSLRLPREEPRWPFRGGWALLLGYELGMQVEPVLQLPPAPGGLPVAIALRCPAAVLRDRGTGECLAVAERGHEALLERIADDVRAAASLAPVPQWQPPSSIVEDDPRAFTAGVERILDYLAAGDVFQVNLSRAWRARFAEAPQPAELYARLRQASPAPV